MSRSLFDPVDTTQVGSLLPRLKLRVNGEVYRFSRDATLVRFRRDPVRWCGILRDPVTGVRFFPSRHSPRYDLADGPYVVPSDSSRGAFVADTVRFAIHRAF
jgi:YHS domain-containing protein